MTPPPLPISAFIAFVSVAAPAAAKDPMVRTLPDAGAAFGEAIVLALDADRSGTIEIGELDQFGREVFASIDADGSGSLSRAEMTRWPGGLGDLAAFRGRDVAYLAATAFLFDDVDRDDDGGVDAAEHLHGLRRMALGSDAD